MPPLDRRRRVVPPVRHIIVPHGRTPRVAPPPVPPPPPPIRGVTPHPRPNRRGVRRPAEQLTKTLWPSLSALYQKHFRVHCAPPIAKTTIVITNWQRPQLLRACLDSVAKCPLPIVVSCSALSEEVITVLSAFLDKRPDTCFTVQNGDQGCNEQWLRGVYAARTPYVLILHDDDQLAPCFAETYTQEIEPQLGEVNWVVWDGEVAVHGKPIGEYHRQCTHESGRHPTGPALKYIMDSRGARSPVVQIFQRALAIRTLKEVEAEFKPPVFFTKPTMVLGNDVLLGLRHAAAFPEFLYLNKALTYYGRWPGSETEMHALVRSRAVINGQQAAREYFKHHLAPTFQPRPRAIHVSSQYPTSGEALRRYTFVLGLWQMIYDQGPWLPCFVLEHETLRNGTNVGDPYKVPYISDLLNLGLEMAAPEDILVLTNNDICIPSAAAQSILERTVREHCTFAYRRDVYREVSAPIPLNKLGECKWFVGSDLFAMSTYWWERWRAHWPDLLLGRPTWDWMMRALMGFSTEGKAVFDRPLAEQGQPHSLGDVIYHEVHDAWAEVPKNREGPAIRYCFRTTWNWITEHYGHPTGTKQDWLQEFPWVKKG